MAAKQLYEPGWHDLVKNGRQAIPWAKVKVSYGLWHEDKFFQCPYNEHHHILDGNWVKHLIKCRKQALLRFKGPESEFPIKMCQYNSCAHHMHQDLIETHEDFCENRKIKLLLMRFNEVVLALVAEAKCSEDANGGDDWEHEKSDSNTNEWLASFDRLSIYASKAERRGFWRNRPVKVAERKILEARNHVGGIQSEETTGNNSKPDVSGGDWSLMDPNFWC